MPAYYLDIETTGLEPDDNEIITIQWCELERNTGRRTGDVNILKSWESSERDILTQFTDSVRLQDPYEFNFIPVGYNLAFEHGFLSRRSGIHGTFPIDIISRPYIDLQQLSILMNRGEFKGTKLSDMTNKPSDGRVIPEWYRQQEFSKIEEYVRTETDEFVKFIQWAFESVPGLTPSLRARFS